MVFCWVQGKMIGIHERIRTPHKMSSPPTAAETIALLKKYAEDVGNQEQILARIVARWLAVEPAATTDPLLSDLLDRARFHAATHAGADSFLFASAPGRKSNILDYFGVATTPSVLETAPIPHKRYRIYCDGACQANGRRGAKAGYGAVVFAPNGDEVEMVSEALVATEAQTNQRAELRALKWAFEKATTFPEGAEIHTDSEYAMKCFTEWGALWAAKGWRKASGGEVLHQDLLRPMWEVWKSRGNRIRLHHVSAHTGGRDIHSLGNARADRLAVSSLGHN